MRYAFFARRVLGGVRAQPILLGTSPFGMIYGIVAYDAGLPFSGDRHVAHRLRRIVAVYRGAVVRGRRAGVVIVLTTFVANLRHMLYSASVAPYIRHLSAAWKWLLAFLLTDEVSP